MKKLIIFPISRKSNLVIQEMDNEILIYDLTTNKAFCLNETSALVWQLSDGSKSITEISQILGQKLGSPASEDIVWFALDQLKKESLIENQLEVESYFAGIPRREVIKRVGLGTMIALPIVASMIAPLALHAQSADCATCIKYGMGDVCGGCANVVGTCYDNTGCGAGQATTNVTCANCQAGVGSCAGGGATCSWATP